MAGLRGDLVADLPMDKRRDITNLGGVFRI